MARSDRVLCGQGDVAQGGGQIPAGTWVKRLAFLFAFVVAVGGCGGADDADHNDLS